MRVVIAAMLSAAMCVAPAFAVEQPYPTKPVRFIMPVPPGGGTDQLGRIVAQEVTESWKQALVIDNRGGASGMIGHDLASKSSPDGYTVVMGFFGPIGVNVHLMKLPYDPINDFTPITLLSTAANLLIVHPSTQVKTVKELIALARAKPATLNYSSGGLGSAPHLSGELFNRTMNVQTTHVPYKGAAAAVRDLMAGQVQFGFISVPSSLAQIQAGRMHPIAIAAAKRSAILPYVPTVNEAAAVSGFESYQWWGPLVPVNTPDWIVRRLNRDFVMALKDPDVHQKLSALGYDVVGNSPEEYQSFIRGEISKWGKLIKSANIRAQ